MENGKNIADEVWRMLPLECKRIMQKVKKTFKESIEADVESIKKNNMKNGIKAEKYYFLLDWKDKNMEEYILMKGRVGLCNLTPQELNSLYKEIKTKENQKNN